MVSFGEWDQLLMGGLQHHHNSCIELNDMQHALTIHTYEHIYTSQKTVCKALSAECHYIQEMQSTPRVQWPLCTLNYHHNHRTHMFSVAHTQITVSLSKVFVCAHSLAAAEMESIAGNSSNVTVQNSTCYINQVGGEHYCMFYSYWTAFMCL